MVRVLGSFSNSVGICLAKLATTCANLCQHEPNLRNLGTIRDDHAHEP